LPWYDRATTEMEVLEVLHPMDADRIAALKDELRRDLDAVERVERMLAFKNGSLMKPNGNGKQSTVAPLNLDETVAPDDEYDTDAPVDSLRGTVERIVNSDPNERWTTAKVLQRLIETKFDLRAAKPIYSVGQSLNVLVKKGRIRLVRKGAGSAPNVYKAKAADPDVIHPAPPELKQIEF
jgi:hypothetical protein